MTDQHPVADRDPFHGRDVTVRAKKAVVSQRDGATMLIDQEQAPYVGAGSKGNPLGLTGKILNACLRMNDSRSCLLAQGGIGFGASGCVLLPEKRAHHPFFDAHVQIGGFAMTLSHGFGFGSLPVQ